MQARKVSLVGVGKEAKVGVASAVKLGSFVAATAKSEKVRMCSIRSARCNRFCFDLCLCAPSRWSEPHDARTVSQGEWGGPGQERGCGPAGGDGRGGAACHGGGAAAGALRRQPLQNWWVRGPDQTGFMWRLQLLSLRLFLLLSLRLFLLLSRGCCSRGGSARRRRRCRGRRMAV